MVIWSLDTTCSNLFGSSGTEEQKTKVFIEAEVSNYSCLGLDEVGPDGLEG